MSLEEVAFGYIKVANEAMCRPIRNLTESRGYDTSKHILACFGAAGGKINISISLIPPKQIHKILRTACLCYR